MDQQTHYKEKRPSETINKLKNILLDLGIETDEQWKPQSTVGTYSCRVTVKGSNIGTNGKGVSKEYALASAYGEFFERYQNKALAIRNYKPYEKFSFYFVKDETYMDTVEILQNHNSFLDMILEQLNLNNVSESDKVEKFEALFGIRKGENGKYLMYPFYNATRKRVELLPGELVRPYYGSNGMCAGNKFHEAVVQGLSELFERHVQKKVISEKLSLPDVPESFIRKFPQVHNMYQIMMNEKNYKFVVKDCSLGGKFPVVAVVVIEKNTGKYGVHFGSHPDFGIALERCFTESCQGKDIKTHAKSSTLDFLNRRVNTRSNVYNLFGINQGQYPYQFLLESSSQAFVPFEDVSQMSNEEMLENMINKIETLGYEVLIRDVSILDIPSYQIVIPNFSELSELTEMDVKIENTFRSISKLLHKPSEINSENVSLLLATIHFYHRFNEYNCMQKFYSRNDNWRYPYEDISCDIAYFLSMCYVLIEDYQRAAEYIGLIIGTMRVESQDSIVLNATKKYFEGRVAGLSHIEVMALLENFYDLGICDQLQERYKSPKSIIKSQYPDDVAPTHENSVFYVLDRLNEKELNNSIDQSRIGEWLIKN